MYEGQDFLTTLNMATGGISYSESVGSEDLSEVVCDPCKDDGELFKAVGMCVDCQDYLCQRCFDAHKIARAYRKHELLDKESMLQSQSVKTKDKCIEKCSEHENEVTRTIVRAEYIQDINVKAADDKSNCDITGLVVLPDNRLVLTDFYQSFFDIGNYCCNGNIKLVDVKHGNVITKLKLSSTPFDVAMVLSSQVAVTLPCDNKVVFINVAASDMIVDRFLEVGGECHGIDYKEGQLVVTFRNPYIIKVLTEQGSVLHTITNDNILQTYLNFPHVVFGHDNTSLYVSNTSKNMVVCVRFDGTVMDTYTHGQLSGPHGLMIDNSGHVYVCGSELDNIHQFTSDCKNSQVLLTRADKLAEPKAIGYSEKDCRMYVGMHNKNVVAVYKVIFGTK